jgi:hypothetical protein
MHPDLPYVHWWFFPDRYLSGRTAMKALLRLSEGSLKAL